MKSKPLNHSYSTKPCNHKQEVLVLSICSISKSTIIIAAATEADFFNLHDLICPLSSQVFPLLASYVCFWFFWCCLLLRLFFVGCLVLFGVFFNRNMLFTIRHSGSPLSGCLFKFLGLKISLIWLYCLFLCIFSVPLKVSVNWIFDHNLPLLHKQAYCSCKKLGLSQKKTIFPLHLFFWLLVYTTRQCGPSMYRNKSEFKFQSISVFFYFIAYSLLISPIYREMV